MDQRKASSRRTFLGQSAGALGGALAAPYFLTAAARAQEAAPSDRPVIALIGCGGQGRSDMQQAKRFADVAAVCDVDSDRVAEGARDARRRRGPEVKVDQYEDYRRVLERADVDAVIIGTPDHWHTKIAIEAMQAGKDVYCEKPLTLTIEEGQLITAAVKKHQRVFQVGTQQRSDFRQVFLNAMALVREGRLGKVSKVTCAIGGGPESPPIPAGDAPKTINWDMWLGQTPLVAWRAMGGNDGQGRSLPYHSRCHYEFRWWYEYSGGKLTDWGAHHVDIASWALGLDETGPSKVRVMSAKMPVPYERGWPTVDDRYNTAVEFDVAATFPGVEMRIVHDMPDGNGILFEGDKGRIHVNRDRIKGRPFEQLKDNPLPEDALTKVYRGVKPMGHMENFFACVKDRGLPISDVFSHHRAMTTCHLANIALRLDREITWDPAAEKIVGDEEAATFVRREQRKGYDIPTA
ncbi:MAG TPA: Gfo/Idh/MocA family oxidoreductase [Lacipirellulaceae bacterium]|nr:Gfo/Idh/MocA family oxidoreductase [Lacipirellulaceae bacterium]